MKLGFYGGTFDPIHHGHLILAREAVETLGLDRLYFIPNSLSPHKAATIPAPAQLRAEMIRAAIANEPRFDVDELEMDRSGVSYTIDSLLALRERFGPKPKFYYLIGEDNVATLSSWRRADELARLATFVVLCRSAHATPLPYQTLHRRIDISATEIRKRIANGQSIRYLVPDKVHDLIIQNSLYR
ncbi:MAG: nicotinate-nucleotide adenylyltransferase [Chthoniobacteraceae bacterium]|nr:nicotinate-nucleotide adenylyltransferase [Chthoniobacteraceae bacterium]